jgi:CRP-like cAMP-binding protein
MVLWDLFTGSAPYREIILRALHPAFLGSFVWNVAAGSLPKKRGKRLGEDAMETGELGKVYRDGEVIIRQGEVGDCMFVIQAGRVGVFREKEGKEVPLAVLGEKDFFGEMAIFEREVRSATVRAIGEVRVLTVDKRTLLRRIQEDPSLAFRILQEMCRRIRRLDAESSESKEEHKLP